MLQFFSAKDADIIKPNVTMLRCRQFCAFKIIIIKHIKPTKLKTRIARNNDDGDSDLFHHTCNLDQRIVYTDTRNIYKHSQYTHTHTHKHAINGLCGLFRSLFLLPPSSFNSFQHRSGRSGIRALYFSIILSNIWVVKYVRRRRRKNQPKKKNIVRPLTEWMIWVWLVLFGMLLFL